MSVDKDFLHRQLIRLGDMIGDGAHHEPGGQWITKEYRQILKALGIGPKRKRKTDVTNINEFMAKSLKKNACFNCSGRLKQTRSGSLRAVCTNCGNKYQLGQRKTKKK